MALIQLYQKIGISNLTQKNWMHLKKTQKFRFKNQYFKTKRNNLFDYLSWLSNVIYWFQLLLSVHICNYLDKQVVMLAGPTNFSDKG